MKVENKSKWIKNVEKYLKVKIKFIHLYKLEDIKRKVKEWNNTQVERGS